MNDYFDQIRTNTPVVGVPDSYYSIKSAQSPAHYMNFFVLYAFSFGITAFAKLP